MGLFNFRKKDKVQIKTITNNIGDEVNIIKDDLEEVRIEKIDMSVWLQIGEQYCPDCHKLTTHKNGYYECDNCNWSITDEEAEDGEGYPTLESTYENDFGYFNK